jgi:hypothetical protein
MNTEIKPNKNGPPFRNKTQVSSTVVRFEFLTAVTMKNGVFWDVTPCGHGVTSQKTPFFKYNISLAD